MGRKEERAELMSVRVMQEQEWAYLANARHLNAAQIAMLSIEPPHRGGLGYYKSPQQVRGLINTYVARMADALEESPALRVQLALDDMHAQQVRLKAMTERIDRQATALKARELGVEMDDPICWVLRNERDMIAVESRLLAVNESIRKLKGLDEASKVDITVTTTTDAELAALAEQLGMPKVAKR